MAELLGLLGVIVTALILVCIHLHHEVSEIKREAEVLGIEVGALRARVKTHDKFLDELDGMSEGVSR